MFKGGIPAAYGCEYDSTIHSHINHQTKKSRKLSPIIGGIFNLFTNNRQKFKIAVDILYTICVSISVIDTAIKRSSMFPEFRMLLVNFL